MLKSIQGFIEKAHKGSAEERDRLILFLDNATELRMLEEVTPEQVGEEWMERIIIGGMTVLPAMYGFPIVWGAKNTELRKLDDLTDEDKKALEQSFRNGRRGPRVLEHLRAMLEDADYPPRDEPPIGSGQVGHGG